MLVASSDTSEQTFDVTTGKVISTSRGLGKSASFAGLLWSPDKRTLYASGASGLPRHWLTADL